MQIKKPLSVVCYTIFLIYSWVFGEYMSAAGLNEIYEAKENNQKMQIS